MSPRKVQPECSSQRSTAVTLPSTVPYTVTDPVRISPVMCPFFPTVSRPLESIVPSTSPSITSSLVNLTEPLMETPLESTPPGCRPPPVPLLEAGGEGIVGVVGLVESGFGVGVNICICLISGRAAIEQSTAAIFQIAMAVANAKGRMAEFLAGAQENVSQAEAPAQLSRAIPRLASNVQR